MPRYLVELNSVYKRVNGKIKTLHDTGNLRRIYIVNVITATLKSILCILLYVIQFNIML